MYIITNSFFAREGPLSKPCGVVRFYKGSAAKWPFVAPDPHKHVTSATLTHGSVANSK